MATVTTVENNKMNHDVGVRNVSSSPYTSTHKTTPIYDMSSLMWMSDLWSWAERYNIKEESLPRDDRAFLALKKLDLPFIFPNRDQCFAEIGLLDLPEGERIEYVNSFIERTTRTDKNRNVYIPAEIGRLTGLEDLCMGMSSIECLPDDIVNLKSLTKLCLCWNPNLILTEDQKIWIRELEERGADVSYDEDLMDRCTWSFWE